ncbi:DNA polymerase III subunit alpha [Solwaraspora sp. WMMA2080]|uniref:DNA polymerase III subunit alpha n=1 Tax=unclassified Solwaraspora TaxID=2627926 RepID=UPI00248B6925|nr:MULTISPECIES: DNA polymerase III subunit alpha [unclassified Solwaraspora]WBB94961.1 DNA polymerase III subunit alpha [Solwaraspora sp. WMMA2059]WBC21156.1 DNA polymerase III subunit alpha [Solwaraspora sp. WMMA2080]
MSDSFVHLHVHTEYSMLDGAARLKELFAEANRLEMPALAMTDHGNLFGAYDFFKQATGAGVKPIIGLEAYLTPGTDRRDRTRVRWADGGENDVSGGGAYTHMTMLAADADGLRNLFRLGSRASLEGYFYKPRADRELLNEYGKGIIATTGCPSGEVQTWLRIGDFEKACASAAEFRDIFGADNFYLELMDHGLGIETRVRDDLIRLGKRLNLKPVATNDLHYTHERDADAHEVLLCVQSGSTMADPKRFKFDARDFYLKSAADMRKLWDAEVPGACDNTLEIAEKIGDYSALFASRDLMPQFPVPAGETEESFLRAEVLRGLERRFPGGVPDGHRRQAEYELDVILKMGFPGYFLVTADLVHYAKREGIRVGPGRGSAAGALIAYALGITELDPIPHGLLFERFLNPDRVSMPDIDMDFDERRRGDMIRYATERYGEERVAQIITYGTIKAKAAIKDAARVLGYPFAMGDRITKAMPPPVMGKDIPLTGIFDPKHPRYPEAVEFRGLYESDGEVRKIVDTAKGLEGLKRQWGVHAAGVILSRDPLVDVLPIQKREQDGAIITQWDMGACESIGLLKMDFLGLRNLTVMDDCLAGIAENQNLNLVLEDLPLDDKRAYELLARGDTLGVFQLDGGPMRSLLRSMVPDNFEDISAVLALYRPGPMGANAHNEYADRKNNRKPVVPIHPELAEPLADILGDTYGLIVYQEQVMAIAQQLAGYTLGAADLLRRAMGKKKKEILDKEYVPFSQGMRDNGYSDEAIKTLWDILVPFSDYAFNKAHTAGYGLVSYWTAYLKANYPAEYMAALLTSVGDDKDKAAVYLAECRRMKIKVLPPDVNASGARFTAVGADIRFGLAAVRNVGTNVVDAIARCRKDKGAYTDFYDFLRKVDAVACNKRTVESLIKAGAFDSLGHTRRGLLTVHADAIDSFMDLKRNEAVGQYDLFGDAFGAADPAGGGAGPMVVTPPIPDGEWDKTDLLTFEREMLGLYVSDHPLFGVEHVLANAADMSIAALSEDGAVADGTVVNLAGILSGVQRRITKQGRAWASATLEDLGGAVEVLFFPNTYELVGQYIAEDAIVVVKGRVDRRDDQPRLMAMDLSVPEITSADEIKPIVIALSPARCTPPLVDSLRDVLTSHPGSAEVHVKLVNGGRATLLRLGPHRVAPTTALMADLKALLGPTAVAG